VRTQSGLRRQPASAFLHPRPVLATSDRAVFCQTREAVHAATVTIEKQGARSTGAVRILARTHVLGPGDVDLALLEAPANTSRTSQAAGPPEKAFPSFARWPFFFRTDAANARHSRVCIPRMEFVCKLHPA